MSEAPLHLIEVQTLWAVCLYNKKMSFHEIIKECTASRWSLAGNALTQVNAFEDDSEEEEKESDGQAAINLVDGDAVQPASGKINVQKQTMNQP